MDPATDWYSVSVPLIIHIISYNIGPRYNGTRLYVEEFYCCVLSVQSISPKICSGFHCFCWFMWYAFTYIPQRYFTSTKTVIWSPQCQWNDQEEYVYGLVPDSNNSIANTLDLLQCCINSLRLSDAYMHQKARPSLAQIMACRLISPRPLSETMLPYCQLDPKEYISMKFYLKFKSFHSRELSNFIPLLKFRNG